MAAAAVAAPPVALPPVSVSPLDIVENDPVIAIGHSSADPVRFREAIAAAVARNPAVTEVAAGVAEAQAGRAEARAGLFPSGDVTISNYQVLDRAFSNDPQNIIERSRAARRTDAQLSITQTLFDFGLTSRRVQAGSARVSAANSQLADTSDAVALRAAGAWIEVFAYRTMYDLSVTFAGNQRQLRRAVESRIAQGVSARGDIAQVDSFIGNADRRMAETQRALASAEARYEQIVGAPAPADLARAPAPELPSLSKDAVVLAATRTPAVRTAESLAVAAKQDARATLASSAPSVTVGVDAGRYGLFETPLDYDIRARVTLRARLFGGVKSRIDAADARANSATARADRAREESVRDASIAWSDLAALDTELEALERSYIASRQSRDVLVARFKVSRGTLFDVLSSEDNFFSSATAYIRSLAERDNARYILASKTGNLLPALGIDPARGMGKR